MELFWKYGPMFVRELLEHYEEPRPHFNTLSTIVRRLEQGGYIGHSLYPGAWFAGFVAGWCLFCQRPVDISG